MCPGQFCKKKKKTNFFIQLCVGTCRLGPVESHTCFCSVKAVSYTHLDVYKRQHTHTHTHTEVKKQLFSSKQRNNLQRNEV